MTDVQKQVLSQMYGSSKLLQVKPGAFDFYFTYGTSKKVPVVFRGKITTNKSYYLAHTEFYPSMVTVYANKQQLDKLQTVLRTFPSKVTVRFTIGASLFRTIKPNLFKVVVDYEELAANPSDKCTLQLRSVPRSVSKASLEIDRVDYLLEQQ